MLSCSVLLLALFASAQGRAVNISNTWVLPEEGFPVFYRYFRDRISWYEADAVCQFHHANLVTVDTTAQYDAVRAYLKELDISSAVWVGLIRSNPDGDFTWTDYRGLSSDGYWSASPDARAAPLCAAADPAADYRWEARACGGPTVASFICELPVPQWALGNEGCMVRAIPALTVLYLPESAAVQLSVDCGLTGVKRVQCTGNVKREDLLKDLSCEDDEPSATPSLLSVRTTLQALTEATINDQEMTDEATSEESVTDQENDSQTTTTQQPSTTRINLPTLDKLPTKGQIKANSLFDLNSVFARKTANLNLIHNNNLQSNDIPKMLTNDNYLSLEQSEKLEDEKHMHHKMLHDELARHANFETIFTQPTDHFVPPLVMAKAKISDDMTVLSLAEKHAQQLAEQRFAKHFSPDKHDISSFYSNKVAATPSTTEKQKVVEMTDKPVTLNLQPIKDFGKNDKAKSGLPKKYIEKYEYPKAKYLKVDNKLSKIDMISETESTTKTIESTTMQVTETSKSDKLDAPSIDITVVLKETKSEKNESGSNKNTFSDDVSKIEVIRNTTAEIQNKDSATTETNKMASIETQTDTTHDVTLNHEIVKITILSDMDDVTSPTPLVFEITTRLPSYNDSVTEDAIRHSISTQVSTEAKDATTKLLQSESSLSTTHMSETDKETTLKEYITSSTTIGPKVKSTAENNNPTSEPTITTTAEVQTTPKTQSHITVTDDKNITEVVSTTVNNLDTTLNEKIDIINITVIHGDDYVSHLNDSEAIDDFQSPLLSAANEPLHRPNRSRRPQQQSRIIKFNPFRILG